MPAHKFEEESSRRDGNKENSVALFSVISVQTYGLVHVQRRNQSDLPDEIYVRSLLAEYVLVLANLYILSLQLALRKRRFHHYAHLYELKENISIGVYCRCHLRPLRGSKIVALIFGIL